MVLELQPVEDERSNVCGRAENAWHAMTDETCCNEIPFSTGYGTHKGKGVDGRGLNACPHSAEIRIFAECGGCAIGPAFHV